MRAVIGAALLVAGLGAPAWSHTAQENGEPVPDWISKACCSKADYHHLQPDQVHVVQDGYKIDGYNEIIPYGKVLPSPDNERYIFYFTYPDGSQSQAYCTFLPPQAF